MKIRILFASAFLATLTAGGAVTDVDPVVHQPADYMSFHASENWGGDIIQTGDDLVVAPGFAARITKATFTMVVSWPDVPRRFSFEIYRTIPNDFWSIGWSPLYRPADFTVHPATRVIDRGEWTGGGYDGFGHTLHEVEVIFDDLDIVLEPGVSLDNRWFFSPVGHITHPNEQISYWATAGDGGVNLNWSRGWVRVVPHSFPGWWPIANHLTTPEFRPLSDFAMRLEGELFPHPEPAELADFEIVRGEHLRGDLDDLAESDDQYLAVSSGGGERFGEFQRTEIIITAHTDVANVTRMDLAVEARRAGEGEGVIQLALRNWRSGQFEEIASFPVGFANESFEMTGIDAADFVSETGDIDLDLRHETLLPFLGFGFDTWLDYVHIIVAMEE